MSPKHPEDEDMVPTLISVGFTSGDIAGGDLVHMTWRFEDGTAVLQTWLWSVLRSFADPRTIAQLEHLQKAFDLAIPLIAQEEAEGGAPYDQRVFSNNGPGV